MNIAIAHTTNLDSREAGEELGREIEANLAGLPDALIVFASPRYDYKILLETLQSTCRPRLLVGCSSAGEFTSDSAQVETACVLALQADDMAFAAGLGEGLKADRKQAAADIVAAFGGISNQQYAYRSALVLTDALAGFADSLIEEINLRTNGMYQLFGGGAGDDAKFQRTHVFFGTQAHTDAAVALEILSNKPIGVGVRHGWEPAGPALRVTESTGSRVLSLNASPAVEAFQRHAEESGQRFALDEPLPFFLSNVLGIETEGQHRLRVPLSLEADGAITFAAEVPEGSVVRIMRASAMSAAEAAEKAARHALSQMDGHKPKAAIFFDCVATRLRTGQDFGLELKALQNSLLPARYIGCNTYGQIARSEGQFGGFHNCTAVIGIFPE